MNHHPLSLASARSFVLVFVALMAAVGSRAEGQTTELIPVGSVWRYLDNGWDQGSAWRTPAFDDSAWASGPAQLGYGDGDEATVVGYGPNASAKYITTYFRRAFTVTNPAAFGSMQLRILRDDGAVVYLNGVEVFRTNMPAGAIAGATLASTAIGGVDETTFQSIDLSPSMLVAPLYVLPDDVHSAVPTTHDISFSL